MSTDYVQLIGAEEVRRAAHEITEAARRMENAMVTLHQTLYEASNRFERLVERLEKLARDENENEYDEDDT